MINPSINCDICMRSFDGNSIGIVHLGNGRYRCKACDDSPYPDDWYEDDEDDDYIDPFDLDAHPIRCAVCGGEMGESWSTCDCEDGPTEY